MEPVRHDFPLRDLAEHEPEAAGGIDGGGSCGGARVNGPVQHSAQNRAGAPHIVGPDVGTAAALFLAAKAPERVTSLTIGGAAVRYPIEAGGALKDIIEAPGLDDVRGLDARTNIGQSVQPAAPSDTEPEVHEDYVSAYDLGRFAESARFVRHYREQNPALRDLLPTITTPTQIVAGRNDELMPWPNNQYLHQLLPNSEIHPLDAGHFAWEQAAEEYGRLVADWVSGGPPARRRRKLEMVLPGASPARMRCQRHRIGAPEPPGRCPSLTQGKRPRSL